MIKDTNTFRDLESFVEHLKKINGVVGIVEYGGRTYKDMSIGSDYDLTVIFEKPVSKNINGIHFHIAGIPIDCMILSVEDFNEVPRNEYLTVHLNCTILFDRDNITKNILDRIKTEWKVPIVISDFEKNLFRFTFKHITDKLEHRLFDDILYSKYFIFSSFDWFLVCYARIINLEVGKQKSHLKFIENQNPELFQYIEKLYSSNDLKEQFEMLKKCADKMLESIEGTWANKEILFHLDPDGVNDIEEQVKTANLIFGL
jgi:hypothetical protein